MEINEVKIDGELLVLHCDKCGDRVYPPPFDTINNIPIEEFPVMLLCRDCMTQHRRNTGT
jgi:NAD-dependent SIR2 family protein deacetylase